MEIDSVKVRIWLENPCDGYRWFWSQADRCYSVYLWHLHAAVEPPDPRKVLSMFYATMVVFVIQSILHDSVALSYRPIALILEEHNRALYGLLDYFWGINFELDLRGRNPANSVSQGFQGYVMLVANLAPKYNGRSPLVSMNHEFIALFIRRW